MIDTISLDISEFLDAYDRLRATDRTAVAKLFNPTFLVLDPSTATALTPAVLAGVLPARKRMFESAGIRATRRTNAREQRLDELHSLVQVEWVAERESGAGITLSSTFVLRRSVEGMRIVVYLNHRDVRALLEEQAS